MRIGVIADVHANLPGLEAVLGALEGAGVDTYLCAGDLVGYGPWPNECVERVAALPGLCVAGNHDLIATDRLGDDRCEPLARTTLAWTREHLGSYARAYLEALPLSARLEDILLTALVLDRTSGEARFLAVAYDTARVRRALAAADLPRRAYHLPPSPARRLARKIGRR